jgi:hypothetical protein
MLFLDGILKQRKQERRERFKKALIHHEAKIGGTLFGEVSKDRRREFFCLDKHTWVWHEEWKDEQGNYQSLTTRYDVRPSGILKSQGHMSYQALTPEETKNFKQAVRLYKQKIDAEYDRLLNS